MRILNIFVLCFMATGAVFAGDKLVTVTGNATIVVEPDMATIVIGASTTKKTAREAMAGTAKTIERVIGYCRAMGVNDTDMQTSRIMVDKEIRWVDNTQKFAGYKAESSLEVTVRLIDTLGELTQRLVNVDGVKIDRLGYSHSKLDSLRRAASAAALEDARRAATELCATMKVKLGEVVYLSNSEPPPNGGVGAAEYGGRGGDILSRSTSSAQGLPVKAGRIEVQGRAYAQFLFE